MKRLERERLHPNEKMSGAFLRGKILDTFPAWENLGRFWDQVQEGKGLEELQVVADLFVRRFGPDGYRLPDHPALNAV
jgi:hypothetical protein